LSSSGIKVPCREPWETKSFKRRETVHGNEEESRQEEETLSERDARSEFPRVSGEKHLSGGFFVCGVGNGRDHPGPPFSQAGEPRSALN